MILPRLRREFEEAYPEVRFEQRVLNQTEIFSQIRRAELDVAMTYDLDIPTDLDFVPLLDLPPYVMVGEEHPLADRSSVSVAELEDHKMVLLDLPLQQRLLPVLFCRGQRQTAYRGTNLGYGGHAQPCCQWVWICHCQRQTP